MATLAGLKRDYVDEHAALRDPRGFRMSSSWSYLDAAVLPLLLGETVLDAGCGMGRWGALIETNYWEAKIPRPPEVDGFDAFEANVKHCRRRGVYRRVWQQALPSPIEGRWDTVVAIEVLEHLPREQIDETLSVLERAALRRIIVSTPNCELLRPGSDTPVGFNPFEAHLSYVSRDVLARRGYHVRGVGFGRYNSRLAIRAKRLGVRRSLTFVPWRLPSISETIVAYKDAG
jgi:2-polyprenyl-3-methyl-5-hydroxy-6-metoxy-1,4-benzoquinol methylase